MGKRANYLGEFEELVLWAIMRLSANAYGVTIRHELMETAGREVSVGALYTTLERLEQKGFISSRPGEKTPERGGRAKTYFKVEGTGMQALSEAEAARRRISTGVNLGALQGGAA